MHGDAAHYCTKTEGNETIAGESDKETFGSRLTGDENMAAEGYGRRTNSGHQPCKTTSVSISALTVSSPL